MKETVTKEILKKSLDQLKESFDLSLAEPMEIKARVYSKYITFNLNHELFAWPVSNLREVLVNQKIIPIPGRLNALYGVVNHKNQVLPVVNLHHLLGLPSVEVAQTNTLLVTKELETQIAFWVDSLESVLSIVEDDIKPKPISLDKDAEKLVMGEFYNHEVMITLLKPDSLIL